MDWDQVLIQVEEEDVWKGRHGVSLIAFETRSSGRIKPEVGNDLLHEQLDDRKEDHVLHQKGDDVHAPTVASTCHTTTMVSLKTTWTTKKPFKLTQIVTKYNIITSFILKS